jgi:hypothetical protein
LPQRELSTNIVRGRTNEGRPGRCSHRSNPSPQAFALRQIRVRPQDRFSSTTGARRCIAHGHLVARSPRAAKPPRNLCVFRRTFIFTQKTLLNCGVKQSHPLFLSIARRAPDNSAGAAHYDLLSSITGRPSVSPHPCSAAPRRTAQMRNAAVATLPLPLPSTWYSNHG